MITVHMKNHNWTDQSPPTQHQSDVSHVPVMLTNVLSILAPQDDGLYLDATFGGGGYSGAILQAAKCQVWAIDRDNYAIKQGQELVHRSRDNKGRDRLHLIHGTFGDLASLLPADMRKRMNGIVFDLGVSSYHLDQAQRGFSFRHDGPLDMRMGRNGPTAADLVNNADEHYLAQIIHTFGDEKFSRRIARAIVAKRSKNSFSRTMELADLIRSIVPKDKSGLDPATRTFQALRITVNDELNQITQGINHALTLLAYGGKLIVVSFHSLEDRIVKRIMRSAAGLDPSPSRHDPATLSDVKKNASYRLLTTRPIKPTPTEIRINPRSRSARLRVLECLQMSDGFSLGVVS